MVRRISNSVDGSGTDDGYPLPTELLGDRDAGSLLPPLFKLAKLMPSAPNGVRGVRELDKASPLG
jgi:hypothetical protein